MGAYWKVSLPVNIYIKSEEDEKYLKKNSKNHLNLIQRRTDIH